MPHQDQSQKCYLDLGINLEWPYHNFIVIFYHTYIIIIHGYVREFRIHGYSITQYTGVSLAHCLKIYSWFSDGPYSFQGYCLE